MRVCLCVCTGKKEMRVDCNMASCKTVADVQRCPLCYCSHRGAWIASLSNLGHLTPPPPPPVSHSHRHTSRRMHAHTQTYSSWPHHWHLPWGPDLIFLSMNSTQSREEAKAGQHFLHTCTLSQTHTEDRICFQETELLWRWSAGREPRERERRLKQQQKKKISKSPFYFSAHWCVGMNTHSYWTTLANH